MSVSVCVTFFFLHFSASKKKLLSVGKKQKEDKGHQKLCAVQNGQEKKRKMRTKLASLFCEYYQLR